jgi:hypothetical protein
MDFVVPFMRFLGVILMRWFVFLDLKRAALEADNADVETNLADAVAKGEVQCFPYHHLFFSSGRVAPGSCATANAW